MSKIPSPERIAELRENWAAYCKSTRRDDFYECLDAIEALQREMHDARYLAQHNPAKERWDYVIAECDQLRAEVERLRTELATALQNYKRIHDDMQEEIDGLRAALEQIFEGYQSDVYAKRIAREALGK